MNENSESEESLPLSHSLERSGETPAVEVCGTESRFTHVTVVPTCTVMSSSVKSTISDFNTFPFSDEAGAAVGSRGTLVEVEAAPTTAVGSGADVGAAEAGDEEVSPPQATSVIPIVMATTNT